MIVVRKAGLLAVALCLALPVLAVAQTPDDPGAMLSALLTAIQGRNWIMVAGLVLAGVVYALRRWGSYFVPWFATDRGGAALALILGVLGAVGTVLVGGKLSAQTILDGVLLGISTAGGYAVVKKLIFPSDVAKA